MYNLDTSRVKSANILLGTLYAKVSSCTVPDFGSNMLSDDDRADSITLSTIKHRIVNKFEPSDEANDTALRSACNAKWVEFENKLRGLRIYSREHGSASIYRREWWDSLSPTTKRTLFRARDICHTVLGSIKLDLHQARIEFTPGETNVSSGGRVSIEEKLKCPKQWTVTSDAADDFIRLCYHNYSLKSAAKAHFPRLSRSEKHTINFFNDNDGFAVFSELMNKHVLTIVPGSVGDSVPKNTSSRRFINKEPMGNMLLQRLVAFALHDVFDTSRLNRSSTSAGNVNPLFNPLESGQMRHQKMISQNNVSTIDWSNASDSIHVDGPRFLFPSNLNRYLFKYRSPFVLISEGKFRGEEEFSWHMPEKLCSMGNGYCFEVLTLVLLSLARALDPHASVYGDDVIINNDHVDAFVEAAQALGFSLNLVKSFVRSPFRESCGSFYYEPCGYLTSYDIHRCKSETDIVITCNKLANIIMAHPKVRPLLEPTWDALLRLLPTSRVGPFPALPKRDQLDLYAWCGVRRFRRTHMRDAKQRALRVKLIEQYWIVLQMYGIKPDTVNVIEIPVFYPKEIGTANRFVTSPFKRAMYMYSGRSCKNLYRPRPYDLDKVKRRGDWRSNLYFVLPDGCKLSLKRCKDYLNEILIALMTCLRVDPKNLDLIYFLTGGDSDNQTT